MSDVEQARQMAQIVIYTALYMDRWSPTERLFLLADAFAMEMVLFKRSEWQLIFDTVEPRIISKAESLIDAKGKSA